MVLANLGCSADREERLLMARMEHEVKMALFVRKVKQG